MTFEMLFLSLMFTRITLAWGSEALAQVVGAVRGVR